MYSFSRRFYPKQLTNENNRSSKKKKTLKKCTQVPLHLRFHYILINIIFHFYYHWEVHLPFCRISTIIVFMWFSSFFCTAVAAACFMQSLISRHDVNKTVNLINISARLACDSV